LHARQDSKGKGKALVMLDMDTGKGYDWSLHNGNYAIKNHCKSSGETLSLAALYLWWWD
jgi:hypothetical protein